MKVENPKLLTDQQMQFFIENGYILLKSSLPKEFHNDVFKKMESVFENEGNPGNNMIPRIPQIQDVFDDQVIDGALIGLLGKNYYAHPHRHPHFNPPGSSGQNMHKDSWSFRRHHTRWTMAFYYPQNTPPEIGPTGIVSGSQFLNRSAGSKSEIPLHGEAGTIAIVHYDLWHRAMPNQTDRKRFMLKFLFTRMGEPKGPSWINETDQFQTDDPLYREVWNWHRAKPNPINPNSEKIEKYISDLENEDENLAIRSAYRLGEIGESAISALIDKMRKVPFTIKQNPSYALTAIGEKAVFAVSDLLTDEDPGTRLSAVETLADIGKNARSALPDLIKSAKDPDTRVRQIATMALGLIDQDSSNAVPTLIDNLKDGDEWVKRHASLALARIGANSVEATEDLKISIRDPNRYVRANSIEALKRIGTDAAEKAVFDFLFAARWCPNTTKKSTF